MTNVSNIIYIAFTNLDGSTTTVPISFLFSSDNQQLTVDDFITSFFTSCMNNENTDVIRESGYRVSELFVAPSHADERSLSKLKFCKELCYNINGKTLDVYRNENGVRYYYITKDNNIIPLSK